MKTLTLFLAATLLLAGCASSHVAQQIEPAHSNSTDTVTYEQFYQTLSPYGRWMSYPGMGMVWSPALGNFSPYYTNGFWASTNLGWAWNSGYSWGWAPFHYGRWFYENGYGWLWNPGYTWSPAWVSWRQNVGFYGWAPLAPGVAVGAAVLPTANHWTFVDGRYLAERSFYRHTVGKNVQQVFNQSTTINNYYHAKNEVVAAGPLHKDVEALSGHAIATAQWRPNQMVPTQRGLPLSHAQRVAQAANDRFIKTVFSKQQVPGAPSSLARKALPAESQLAPVTGGASARTWPTMQTAEKRVFMAHLPSPPERWQPTLPASRPMPERMVRMHTFSMHHGRS